MDVKAENATTHDLLAALRRDPRNHAVRAELYRRGWRTEHMQFFTE